MELFRSSKLHGWMSDSAVKIFQGSGGLRGRRRREIEAAGRTHLEKRPGEIPVRWGPMSEMAASGEFLVHRRIFCGGSGWLWSGGAPLARRRRGLGAAGQSGAVR